MSEPVSPPRVRLHSLDQFRGYTVAGMLLVNYLGGFQVCPRILKHTHDYCSYADTIMPQFLFAAGFAMRLGAARLAEGDRSAWWKRIARRFISLSLVAIIWYSICDWGGIAERFKSDGLVATLAVASKRTWFQTLLHIAVTNLWIAPVISRSTGTRVAWAVGSGVMHVYLSWLFNFGWTNGAGGVPSGIDGGPLGFLTWTTTAIAGSIACDILRSSAAGARGRLAIGGVILAAAAYAMSLPTTLYNVPAADPATGSVPTWVGPAGEKLAIDPVVPSPERRANVAWTMPEPPFVPPPGFQVRQWNYWMMSQRGGTWSYTMFGAGIAMILMAAFAGVCDGWGLQVGVFRTLGTNALAAYIFHDVAGWIIEPYISNDASPARASISFGIFFLMVYGACRFLEWRKWYVRM